MTVRDWVVEHTRRAPPPLVAAMLAALGTDGAADATLTGQRCLAAAARNLEWLVSGRHFGRVHALDLLAIDALAALAYEYESDAAESEQALESAAKRGIDAFTQPTLARV